jgi:hypothetical protein
MIVMLVQLPVMTAPTRARTCKKNGRCGVWVAVQATSNVEFVLPMDSVTVGIVSALQFSADLTATPWLKVDYVNNR